jgi:hypothetical protein
LPICALRCPWTWQAVRSASRPPGSPGTIGPESRQHPPGAVAGATPLFGKPVFVESGDNDAVAETNETPSDLVLVSPKFECLAW